MMDGSIELVADGRGRSSHNKPGTFYFLEVSPTRRAIPKQARKNDRQQVLLLSFCLLIK